MSYKGLLVSTLISTFALPATSFGAFWAPHIGADYKWWGLEPNEVYEDTFPRIDHAFNFYVGTRINGYFGTDIGFEESTRKQKGQTFEGGEILFVFPENANDATDINMRIRDFHLDINFYWEVWRNFEIIFMGGLALWHIDTHINHLTDGTWIEFKNESENKAMGRIGIGAQYNIMPCLGIKFLINSDPGIRVNDIGWDQNDNWYSISPYKTAVSYNLGVVYSFANPRRHREMEEDDPYRD
ncbi:MAG: outer membrane beta-barrel protein [Proteobacteria bacterium]|nr:outer membrane beta-barrel protein [Pseudomonadota bacterium]